MAVNTRIDNKGVYPVRADSETESKLEISVNKTFKSGFEFNSPENADYYSSTPYLRHVVNGNFVVVETNTELVLPALNASSSNLHVRLIAGRSFGDGYGDDRFRLSASNDIANTDDGSTGPFWTAQIPRITPPGSAVRFGDVFDLYGFGEEYTNGTGSPKKYWWTIVSSSNFMAGTVAGGGTNAP